MKPIVLLITIFSIHFSAFSQINDKVLISIGEDEISVSEFQKVYEKNLKIIDNEEDKDVATNLELYINYKLKVKEAYRLKLDTLQSYKAEMETYRNQLSAPYLQDKSFIDNLIKEAYFRTKNEVRARHILIRSLQNSTPKDTLIAYNKINKIRDRILNGEPFEKVAREVSEDTSVKINGGDLGYFSAFQMVYQFENAAYNTPVGGLSKPFKTNFGYHIVEVNDLRKSRGEVEVAHILISDTTSMGKIKIDEVYDKLLKNEKFEDLSREYSSDEMSKFKGGKISKFGSGKMIQPFEDVAFSLSEINSFSKPVKTQFGWHIVKLIKKHPIKSFEEMKQELTERVKKSGRIQLSDKAVLDKLKKQYTIVENKKAEEIFKNERVKEIPKDSLQNVLLTINKKAIKQVEFANYKKNRRQLNTARLLKMFKDVQILNFYKENLINTEPEYAYTIKEYEEGLLLFEIMQQEIWNKSAKDSLGLKKFFDKHIRNYDTKELKNIKGEVMNDFQTYLEEKWIAQLRRKYPVYINKSELKKLVNFYQNK